MGAVPDDERGPADRGGAVPQRQADELLRLTRDSRWLALLALPVLCCAGHAALLAVGVGSLTAVVSGAAGSAAVAAAGLLVLAAAAAVVLRRRKRPEAAAGIPEAGAR